MPPPDAATRERALDISESFLVQAPAGSGKTELLTQRFLALLSTVDNPEAIVAITFTRKAAGEMRTRITGALQKAQLPQPAEPHAQRTWQLAHAALAHDAQLQWDLLENPSRLRVLTLDSLCASLTSQMPWLSRMGGPPALADDPATLHHEAALKTLACLEQRGLYHDELTTLLLHLDNNLPRVAELLMHMLGRRDQWLRHIVDGLDRQRLEASLQAISDAAVNRVRHRVPFNAWDLLAYAQLTPDTDDALTRHQALADFLLTKEGSPRSRITKNEGFPPKDPRKPEMESLCRNLDPHFATDLHALRLAPPAHYTDKQWGIIQALEGVLKLAVAQLRIVFQERRTTDFVELTLSATQALGTDAEPTPLAYALDFKIQHLLLDEFQDTSRSKLALLERVIADWAPGDGRTVFAVGDPMQSIYSFQEADVSLFEQCRRQGLGRLPLESLTLRANFRSTSNLVDWFNATFPKVLAPEDDPTSGAVAYSPSAAQRDPLDGPPVICHPVTAETEPSAIADVVESAEGKVAILVRRRADAHAIVTELRRRNILFQAVEMDPLAERSIVQDLRALTRALLHPADRVSWLAILRAPWCGLELAELTRIAQFPVIPEALSTASHPRLQRIAPILLTALTESRRRSLRRHVEETWRALGGPACLRDKAEEVDAQTFFTLLDTLDQASDLPDFTALDEALQKLNAAPDPNAPDHVQVMTMHKSKGLEFDNVILPCLSTKPRAGNSPLLRWSEMEDLVIGTIRETGSDRDAVYDYLGVHERRKADHESGRLLYVAATRAKKRLHLFGERDEKGSFLARLWHAVGDQFPAPSVVAPSALTVPVSRGVPLRRVPENFEIPKLQPALAWNVEERAGDEALDVYTADNETYRIIGTLVHRVLQLIAQQGWSEDREAAIRTQLSAMGVPRDELDAATERTLEVIRQTLTSDRGRWILQDHEEAVNEWEVSGVFGNNIYSRKLDRSFIADGVRWIVDYKTGGNHDQYREQLEQYAELVSRLDHRPIKLGLFFPLTGAWHEWTPSTQAPATQTQIPPSP